MVKKGLSLEQKRERVLEFFHETDSVFQFKEVEKEAVKRGVTAQSVKDVVQSLVDDNLVNQEKIGISNYLWAFAGQASTKLKNEEITLTQKLEGLTKQHTQLQGQVQEERSKQDDPDEHQKLQQTLQELGDKKSALTAEQVELEVVDPKRFEAMKEACTTSRDSANRWLDNLYSLKQWCNKRFSGRETELDKFFEENGLTENVDYLD